MRTYDEGPARVSQICCNTHVVLGTVVYTNPPILSLWYEDVLEHTEDFGLITHIDNNKQHCQHSNWVIFWNIVFLPSSRIG